MATAHIATYFAYKAIKFANAGWQAQAERFLYLLSKESALMRRYPFR